MRPQLPRAMAAAVAILLTALAGGAPGCGDSRGKGPEYPSDGGPSPGGRGEDGVTGGEAHHGRTAGRPPKQRAKAPSKRAVAPKQEEVAKQVGARQQGYAVWYGGELHGSPTASGEHFDKNAMTAAHRTLPMGTTVKVTNTKNGASVTVRVNDRGPFGKRKERIIDVSEAAAKILDIIDDGNCPITLEVLTLPASRKDKAR